VHGTRAVRHLCGVPQHLAPRHNPRAYSHQRTQWVKVYWNVVCSKGTGAGSASGHFSVYDHAGTTVGHNIWHPYRHPDSCTIASDAQINHGTYLHLFNTYYRW
jgi:hypothetical protein